jgi:murein DD-endopeptidase MepM/ murein hydrolase activator NlpD
MLTLTQKIKLISAMTSKGHNLINATNEANGIRQDELFVEYCGESKPVINDIFIGNFGVSQLFGKNPSMYKQFGWKGHNGIDFDCPTGTKLLSGVDGVVTTAYNNIGGWGYHIYIWDKVQKIMTIHAHLKSLNVKVGDKVKSGQLIGLSNNTGNSTGPHLHFGIYKVDGNGNKINMSNGYGGAINPFDKNLISWKVINPKIPLY